MIRARLLKGIAHLACSRPRTVLAVAGVLTLLSLVPPLSIGLTKYTFNIATMLPQEVPEARIFTRAIVDFDSVDQAVVVFRLKSDSASSIRQAGQLADAVAVKLRQHKDIRAAFCRPFSEREKNYFIRETLPRQGLLLLPPEEIEKVGKKLTTGRIRRAVEKTISDLDFIGNKEDLREKILLNALGIGDIFSQWIETRTNKSKTKKADNFGYLVARVNEPSDHEATNSAEPRVQLPDDPDTRALLLLIVHPTQPAQRLQFSTRIMRTIQEITESTLAEKYGPKFADTLRIEYGGGYAISVAYKAGVNSVLVKTLFTSFVGVILLFGYCFRRYGVLIYIGIPLLMVVSWTIGVGWLIFGQLNLISCGFAAVLVGLGVDYAVHIYNRYVEERSHGHAVEESFQRSIEHTGWGIFVGMVTTCLAFLALKATRFDDLSQFGILAALGIAFSVPAMLLVLPSLIVLRNARKPEHTRVLHPTHFGLRRLAPLVVQHRRMILTLGVLLTLTCAVRLFMTKDDPWFDSRLSNMRPHERAIELNGEIARAFSSRNPNKLQILSLAPTEAEALDEAERVREQLEVIKKAGVIDTYETALSVLPSPTKQKVRLAALRKIDFTKARRTLLAAIAEEGIDPAAFQFNLDLLENHAAISKTGAIFLPSSFAGSPVAHLTSRFVTQRRRLYDVRETPPPATAFPLTLTSPAVSRKTQKVVYPAGTAITLEQFIGLRGTLKRIMVRDQGWTVKTNVFPPLRVGGKSAEFAISPAWIADVTNRLNLSLPEAYAKNQHETGSYLSGVGILAFAMGKVIQEDLDKISVWVFIVATVVLCIFFYRHLIRVVYCMVPIALGLLYLLGVMSFFGIQFNFLNILAIPIIIGLGVDNGIHLVNRFYEAGRDVQPMIADTGRAIMLTSLTSMIGFGSLAAGGYPGITSMGVLSIIALATSLLSSLVLFPAFLATISPTSNRPESQASDQD